VIATCRESETAEPPVVPALRLRLSIRPFTAPPDR
jgi:hypothetical protein